VLSHDSTLKSISVASGVSPLANLKGTPLEFYDSSFPFFADIQGTQACKTGPSVPEAMSKSGQLGKDGKILYDGQGIQDVHIDDMVPEAMPKLCRSGNNIISSLSRCDWRLRM
jgi:hypothetical protein